MPKEPEVHPERQGRPDTRIVADEERRIGLVVTSNSSLPLGYLASVIICYEDTVVTNGGSIVYRS